MRVSVTISVEVDPKAWQKEYGQRETPEQIREAIKASIGDVAAEPFRHLIKRTYGEQRPDGFASYTDEPLVKIVSVR